MDNRSAYPDTSPTDYPQTYPTAYPQTYPTAYPQTRPDLTMAERIDPGMWLGGKGGMAADHRGRSVHAGKRTRQVSKDPQVNYLATRKPTVPSIISRQGIKETVGRYDLEASAGALGAMFGAGVGGRSGGGFENLVSPQHIPGALMGAAAGAMLAYGIKKKK
jgi:hypothetical protein